jgi:HSP20 family molecular chaperone IbpA
MYKQMILDLIKMNEEKFKQFTKDQIDNFDLKKVIDIIEDKVKDVFNKEQDKSTTNDSVNGVIVYKKNDIGEFIIDFELPGFDKNNIKMNIENQHLIVKADIINKYKKYGIYIGNAVIVKSKLELGILTVYLKDVVETNNFTID